MTRLPIMLGVIFLGAAAGTAAVVPVRPAPAKPAPTATATATVPAATGTIPKVSPYSLEGMTERAADLQAKITATPQAQRKVLQEELELLHHQMGPRDANGARVHCQAMWHEAQIETLGGDIKRFTLLHEGRATPADDLRLYTRRVAAKCLDEGWALSSGRAKFQVDAFGSYLANNMTMLDGLFARVSAWMTAPAKTDETAEDAAAHLAAIKKIADSITGMAHVADGLDRAPAGDEATVVPLLESYVADLRTINEIDEVISERARTRAKPAATALANSPATTPTAPAATPTAGATGGLPASVPTATPEVPEPEPPPMTEVEKTRVAAVADVARTLVGEGWDEITAAIVRYAGTVEAGFLVPAARPRAREFLRYVERAAALSQELNASKAVYPEYLKDRQAAIGRALAFLGDPKTRARGYTSLDFLWQDDELRRQVERSNISPTAQQGITYAYYVVWQQEASAAAASGEAVAPMGPALRDACRKVAATLEKMQGWPPKNMLAALKPSYARQEMLLRTDMELAGRAYPSDRPNGFLKMRDAATRAGDLELIVRADAALAVVPRLRPQRAGLIGAQVAKLAQDLASSPEAADAPRQTLADLIQPLEDLGRFPTLDAAEARAATELAGRDYTMASAAFQQRAGAGIDALAAGDASALKVAVAARPLFAFVKHLAGSTAYRLDKVPVGNLVTFSVSDKVWSPLVTRADQSARTMMSQYAAQGPGRGPWERTAPVWDGVCQPVAAARRLTLEARSEGETDLDLLVRNLEHVAVPAPAPDAWHGWAAGYHATEAAASLAAGLDTVAGWHRSQLGLFDAFLLTVDLAPPKPEPKGKGT